MTIGNSPNLLKPTDGFMVMRKGYMVPVALHELARTHNDEINAVFEHPWATMTSTEIIATRDTANQTPLDFIYSEFDKLVAKDTTYGAVSVIGTDHWGNDIKEYRFGLDNIERNSQYDVEIRRSKRILVLGPLNGTQTESIFTIMILINDILTNWSQDRWLNDAYSNLEFVIVPCPCPTAINRNNKLNQNNVNINRNFETEWSTSDTTTERGSQANSEKETQVLINWVNSYRGKNIGLIELGTHTTNYGVTMRAYHPMLMAITRDLMKQLAVWGYNGPLVNPGQRPSALVRSGRWGMFARVDKGSFHRHAAVGLRQPVTTLEHPKENNAMLGTDMYWQRIVFRFIFKQLVTALGDQYKTLGFYDNIYG